MAEEVIDIISKIVLPVVGGIVTYLIKYNIQNKKYRLSIGEAECYSILNHKYGNINIGISFNGNVVKNIIHLSFSISNAGSSDLDETIMNKPISIIVPKCFRILDAQSKIEKEKQETTWNENSIYIKTTLLKPKEKIEVTIFVAVDSNNEDVDYCDLLFNSLSFNCRFPKLKKVKIEKYKTRKFLEINNCLMNRVIVIIMAILVTAIPFFMANIIFRGILPVNCATSAFIFVIFFIIGFLSFDIFKYTTEIYRHNTHNKKLYKILNEKGTLKN